MPVETELNGVECCVFGRRATSGCRLNRRLSTFILVRDRVQFCGGNMSRLSLTCSMAFLSTTGAGLAADAAGNSAIPIFATDDRTGWQLDRTFGVDDLIAVPGGGPGPVTFDKVHPYAPPGRPVPTYRVAAPPGRR
jgi:hypothetical protein